MRSGRRSGVGLGCGFRWAVGVAAAVCGTTGSPIAAQEVSLSIGTSSSDYREFADPRVLGAGVVVPAWRWLGVRVDYRRHQDDQEWETSTCQSLIPPDDPSCRNDVFDGEFRFETVGIGPQITVPVAGRLRAFASLLFSRVWLDGVWEGRDTGVTLGRVPEETFNGWSVVGGGLFRITDHLDATLTARRVNADFTVCVLDTYYPFCEGRPLRTVEFGVALRR